MLMSADADHVLCIGARVVACWDIDTDRFRVTVSLAAGREVSGPRRLAHNDIGSLAAFVYIYVNVHEIFLGLTWSKWA